MRRGWRIRVAVAAGVSIAVTVVLSFVSSPDPLRLTGATVAVLAAVWLGTDLRLQARSRTWVPLVRPGRGGPSADLRVLALAHEMTASARGAADGDLVREALTGLADDRLRARDVEPRSEAATDLLGPDLSAYVRGADPPRSRNRLIALSDFVDRIEHL